MTNHSGVYLKMKDIHSFSFPSPKTAKYKEFGKIGTSVNSLYLPKLEPSISFFNSDQIVDARKWVSHRIPYNFYNKAYYNAKMVKISFNQEVINYQEKYRSMFFLDVILHVLISYFKGYGETQNNLYVPYNEHEDHISKVFTNLSTILTAKGSESLHGKRISMKKVYSHDRRTATINFHILENIQDVYPMTIAQYSRSVQNNDLQTLNIITGRTTHSFHGVSLSSALVLQFSCKNNLDSVILENNPGLQSFRIHRNNEKPDSSTNIVLSSFNWSENSDEN